ncbi:MAG TPA: hypothetical protein VMZ28_15290 [Kofleriaceae bacterium]|nr:hypothetical protein [Kofleriaceae bacterium]
MQNLAAVVAVLFVSVACAGEKESPAPGAAPVKAAPSGEARRTWSKDLCSILSADSVAPIAGKPVTPRAQVDSCDYLTGGDDTLSVHYYDNKYGGGEYEIFKGLQDERGGKSKPVPGVGVEALYGNSGTGPGLAVQLADGRSFMVAGRDEAKMVAIAKLVAALP